MLTLVVLVPVQRETVKPKTSFARSSNLSPTLYTVQTKPKLLHQAPSQVRIMLTVTSPSPVPSIMPSQVPSQVPSTIPSQVPSTMPSQVPSQVPRDPPSEPCTIPSMVLGPSTAASAAFMQQTEVVDDHG